MSKHKNFDNTKSSILGYIAKWEPMLDLPGTTVTHRFHDTTLDASAGEDTVDAATVTEWRYRWAVINWYMPRLVRLEEEDLESIVVHEYVHVLIAAMEANVPVNKASDNEIAVENIARALLGVANAYENSRLSS